MDVVEHVYCICLPSWGAEGCVNRQLIMRPAGFVYPQQNWGVMSIKHDSVQSCAASALYCKKLYFVQQVHVAISVHKLNRQTEFEDIKIWLAKDLLNLVHRGEEGARSSFKQSHILYLIHELINMKYFTPHYWIFQQGGLTSYYFLLLLNFMWGKLVCLERECLLISKRSEVTENLSW